MVGALSSVQGNDVSRRCVRTGGGAGAAKPIRVVVNTPSTVFHRKIVLGKAHGPPCQLGVFGAGGLQVD